MEMEDGDNQTSNRRARNNLYSLERPIENLEKIELDIMVKSVYFSKLLDRYSSCLTSENYSEAKQIAYQVTCLVDAQVKTTAEELFSFAIRLRVNGKFFQAILFFHLAHVYFTKQADKDHSAYRLRLCVLGIKKSCRSLLDTAGHINLPDVIIQYGIPLMCDILKNFRNMTGVLNQNLKWVHEVWCLSHIETTYEMIMETVQRERMLKEALGVMEKNFGDDCANYWIYAVCLRNLGNVCALTFRNRAAHALFRRSVESFTVARDCPSEEQRKKDIERCKEKLKIFTTSTH